MGSGWLTLCQMVTSPRPLDRFSDSSLEMILYLLLIESSDMLGSMILTSEAPTAILVLIQWKMIMSSWWLHCLPLGEPRYSWLENKMDLLQSQARIWIWLWDILILRTLGPSDPGTFGLLNFQFLTSSLLHHHFILLPTSFLLVWYGLAVLSDY